MSEQKNPLLCDPQNGLCTIPEHQDSLMKHDHTGSVQKPVKVIYFTDPICSSCWGIEPQLRKLKLEYGSSLEIEYRMGGLLPDWSYNSGGISKPSDVARHWDEVSIYYDMPIDGDVWLEDPLHSSFPPSIAFIAAMMQNYEKAILFLREIREMVFLHKLNITRWENLEQAAKNSGLDIIRFRQDYEGAANELFDEDLKLARKLGIRGFPTLIFSDTTGNTQTVYGSRPYADFETALVRLYPSATKNNYDKHWKSVFTIYPTLTAKEFSELTGIERSESEKTLNDLTEKGILEKWSTKNGAIWKIKSQP